MIKGIYFGSRSLETRTKNMDSVANNLANINTTGYKRQLPFSEYLMNTGEIRIKQFTDHKQGDLVSTGNPLDVAIDGEGLFALKTEEGTEYTRSGKFKISSDGFLINEQGFKVLGQQGEINIFEFTTQKNQDIQIRNNGDIQIGENFVDSLMIVKLNIEENSKRATGLNFNTDDFNVTALSEDEFQIHQGYIEESNVNPIIEMESMIRMNNDFESAHKIMKHLDQSLGQANEIGKV